MSGDLKLEKVAIENLRDSERLDIFNLAFSLFNHYPALGILMARAAINPDRALDTETLLEEVERARDRLQLPPGDIAQDIYERLIDRNLGFLDDEEIDADAETERLSSLAAEQRTRLKDSSAKVAELHARLQAQEKLLKQYKDKTAHPAKTHDAKSPELVEIESEEARKLRSKIAELKGLITEGHKERSVLRLKLSEATDRREKAALANEQKRGERIPAALEGSSDPEELAAPSPGRWTLLFPTFRNAARDSIRNAPANLVRQALQTTAELACGDKAAWSGSKKLRTIPDVWSVRIGLHYRLLFRLEIANSNLDVCAFIHRRDLESTIAKGL